MASVNYVSRYIILLALSAYLVIRSRPLVHDAFGFIRTAQKSMVIQRLYKLLIVIQTS